MPSGPRHTKASVVVALSASAGLFLYSPPAAFWCSFGALSGIMIGPDWDVNNGNITYHYVRKYAGLPAEFVWRCFLWIYAHVMPHRGVMSHGPIISTLIRLLYISAFVAPVWIYLKLPPPRFSVEAGWWLVGLICSDVTHYFMDKMDEALGGRL